MRELEFLALCLVICLALARPDSGAPAGDANKPRGHHGTDPVNAFNLKVPTHDCDLILARPEKNSVTVSVMAYRDLEGYAECQAKPGTLAAKTPVRLFKKGETTQLLISGLQPDTRYDYQFHFRIPAAAQLVTQKGSFHTARPPGSSPFTFTMTADVHLDEHTSPEVYLKSLANIRADSPDFHVDLGNLFMTEKHASRTEAADQYLAQRYYLGQIGSPLFLALGVHDGEGSKNDDGTSESLAAWSNSIRKRFFPNPVPDEFYSGNGAMAAKTGLLENYYAWEWGDALFVVLDPYRYSMRERKGGGGWGWSLGEAQYRWLGKTLESSHAKFKFVFIHNLLVGDQSARGGVEVAGLNEWGGKNADGTDGFKDHRPGWKEPIHQLLLRNHVAAVFKAHDNFYARQSLDGIVYLMVPQPSFEGNDRIRDLDTYGYKKGVFIGNSGHVRVSVGGGQAKVEYVKSDGTVADSTVILGTP